MNDIIAYYKGLIMEVKYNKNKKQKDKKEISQNKKASWEEENKKAIDFYNERIKTNGLFSDGLRSF
jgi:antitoxin CcdA